MSVKECEICVNHLPRNEALQGFTVKIMFRIRPQKIKSLLIKSVLSPGFGVPSHTSKKVMNVVSLKSESAQTHMCVMACANVSHLPWAAPSTSCW